jgi:hypothetical protein
MEALCAACITVSASSSGASQARSCASLGAWPIAASAA